MNAESAYDLWEVAQIKGLDKILSQIKVSSKAGPVLELTLRRADVNEHHIAALRRRKFHVTVHNLTGNDKSDPRVTISWDVTKIR